MKSNSVAKKILFITLCSILISYVIFSKRGIREYLRMHSEIEGKKQDITDVEKTIETLKNKLQTWKTEDFEREKLAREDLNMGLTNELVYKVAS